MKAYIVKCDRCGLEARSDTDKKLYENYQPINLEMVNNFTALTVRKSYFELCPECLEKLGIVPKEAKFSMEENKNLADRLYDIIAEIVREKG